MLSATRRRGFPASASGQELPLANDCFMIRGSVHPNLGYECRCLYFLAELEQVEPWTGQQGSTSLALTAKALLHGVD